MFIAGCSADTSQMKVNGIKRLLLAAVIALPLSACAGTPPYPSTSKERVTALAEKVCGPNNYRIGTAYLNKPSGASWYYSITAECVKDPGHTTQEYDQIVKKALGAEIKSSDLTDGVEPYWYYLSKSTSAWGDLQVYPPNSSRPAGFHLRVFV